MINMLHVSSTGAYPDTKSLKDDTLVVFDVSMCIEVTLDAINTVRLRLNEINCRKLMFIGLGRTVNPSFI